MSVIRDFSGKVVLITGSSSGIGAQTAIQFAKYGAQVVITGRNGQKLSEVFKQCMEVSPKGLPPLEIVADVRKDEDCKRIIHSTIKLFGKLDILVNNAGFGGLSRITDPNIMEKYDNIMATNLRSVVYLTHLSVEYLEKTKGNIINISSVAGLEPICVLSAYCMSKCALDMFSKCLALELGPKGIRVNVVNPGAVRTNIGPAMGATPDQHEKLLADRAKDYPLSGVEESMDIPNIVLFLASDESLFVTGINVVQTEVVYMQHNRQILV